MAPQVVTTLSENEVGARHLRWVEQRIYSKTILSTWFRCGHAFYLRYIKRVPDLWGWPLIEGIAMHKILEEYHTAELTPWEQSRDTFLHSVQGNIARAESLPPKPVHAMARQAVEMLAVYKPKWRQLFSPPKALERVFGEQEEVTLGGVRIAGSIDAEPEEVVIDWKYCGSSSMSRRSLKLDLGMEMYHRATGKPTALIPLVKLKTPKVEINPVPHTAETAQVIADNVAYAASEIEKGNFPHPDVGSPRRCHPKWCGYFGSQACKFTRHLNRDDWL